MKWDVGMSKSAVSRVSKTSSIVEWNVGVFMAGVQNFYNLVGSQLCSVEYFSISTVTWCIYLRDYFCGLSYHLMDKFSFLNENITDESQVVIRPL